MIGKEICIYTGKITKTLGFSGGLSIHLDPEVSFDPGKVRFFLFDDEGGLIPFFIEEIRFTGKNTLFIQCLDLPSQESAAKWVNTDVYLPRELFDGPKSTRTNWSVEGFTIVDIHEGEIGFVDHVISNTAQDLVIVKSPNGEIMIPAVPEIILSIDSKKKSIKVDLPEGLMNLNR